MSDSSKPDIPLESCHDQRSFRLLEIPSELLGLITSKIPPSLSLKSTSLETSNNSSSSQTHAVLCTDDKTFNVRQVHSSNSIHLIVPTEIRATSHTHVAGELGVTAIAQCATTLELAPVVADATSILKGLIPLYRGSSGLIECGSDLGDLTNPTETRTKQELFENVPLSRREFEEAWLEICAFETDGYTWVPSTFHRSGIWKSIMAAAILGSADLVEGFSPSILKDIVIKQDCYPEALFDAVLRRLCRDPSNTIDPMIAFSPERCIAWVGDTLLETLSSKSGISETEFLHEWQNQLPEQWKKLALCSELKCRYTRPVKGMIQFGINERGNSTSGAPTSGKRLRKWHDKFKSTRP